MNVNPKFDIGGSNSNSTWFYFAHDDRPQRFLAGTGGFSRQKNLFCLKGPIKLCLQINVCL